MLSRLKNLNHRIFILGQIDEVGQLFRAVEMTSSLCVICIWMGCMNLLDEVDQNMVKRIDGVRQISNVINEMRGFSRGVMIVSSSALGWGGSIFWSRWIKHDVLDYLGWIDKQVWWIRWEIKAKFLLKIRILG